MPLVGGGVTLLGNMVVAVAMASPRISWRVLASSRMWILVSCEVSMLPPGEICPVGNSIESIRERAVARASMVDV